MGCVTVEEAVHRRPARFESHPVRQLGDLIEEVVEETDRMSEKPAYRSMYGAPTLCNEGEAAPYVKRRLFEIVSEASWRPSFAVRLWSGADHETATRRLARWRASCARA